MSKKIGRNQPTLKILVVTILGAGVTLASGIMYEFHTDSRGTLTGSDEAGAKLTQIPEQVGDWALEKSTPFSNQTVRILECAGYINRTYANQRTGETVTVALLVGPPGPMSVHTPEICLSTNQYSISDTRRKIAVEADDSALHEFWSFTFVSHEVDAEKLRLYYAWSDGKTWAAPSQPRFKFADRPFIYKLQLAGHPRTEEESDSSDPVVDFLKSFLPIVSQSLMDPLADRAVDSSASVVD